jgi:hypothetical protein
MTVPGRRRKLRHLGLVAAGLAAAALLPWAAPATRAGLTEQIVIDNHSGLAISGYDPVAYFSESRALPGRPDLEYAFAGGVWRFRNEGNREAFKAAPDIYMPRFGGYDPVGVGRGVAIPGNPRLWYVHDARLYLFYSDDHQAAFVLDAERLAATADRKWPVLRRQLIE